ncbi:hypothetical protein [Thalassobaculum litoreum]|uniref:DUF2254 domain-containing protein n=1 Tax=Thalassobaculum litoreum DSM 18839 TaxID=1123362 RepID=A0A8G2BKV0_9PROT|nr:hypothetical protein [Thalassobaculum litoreum]SDG28940.1 hypothetical protein SAMN05660686_03938 [Thalassobaculum litoreum DSM 18839]
MMGSIERAVSRELRAHHRHNSSFRSLSGRQGYALYRLFNGIRWTALPFGFFFIAVAACFSLIFIKTVDLDEHQANLIQDAVGYLLAAQVTLFAVAIPIIIAGAQLLLDGRSAKGRELDLAVLLEFGRPREIAWSSLFLTAVLIAMLVWPHEIVLGSQLSGARPYILSGAILWFLANLAGYLVLVCTAIDLVSRRGRIRLRKTLVAWVGFEEEVGKRIRFRIWHEFREELSRYGLALTTVQELPQDYQWFGFSVHGTVEDVRTVMLRAALRWLRFRSGAVSRIVGIGFYLKAEHKPGRQFAVYERPDLIGRLLLRASLKISRRTSSVVDRFQPSDVLDALGSDVEHQILTGTPTDARAEYDELLDMFHALLAASAKEDGNYATEVPLMSLLRHWARPVYSVSWAAGAALSKSHEFAASISDSLARVCNRSIRAGLSPEVAQTFAEALGLLQYVASRKSKEDGRLDSASYREFLRHSQRATGNLVHGVDRLPESEGLWSKFQNHAEMRLALTKQLAQNIGYVAWIGDLFAFERYGVVFLDFARQLGPASVRRNWSRLPIDLWKWSESEITDVMPAGETLETIAVDWNRQNSLDHLLLFQLIWAQWFAEGVRVDDEWVALLTKLIGAVRRESPDIEHYSFSFGPFLQRFIIVCEANSRGHDELLNEFVHDVDRIRDSDKEGGFYYSDAINFVEDLVPGVVIYALLSFNSCEMPGTERQMVNFRDHELMETENARRILWKMYDISSNLPDNLVQVMERHFSDWTERLAALQESFERCAELFGDRPTQESV